MEKEEKEEEVIEVMEDYTRQLKNSGWGRKEALQIVTSGFKGLQEMIRRRREEGKDLYRSATSSLQMRVRKKLTGKEDWYKTSRKREREEEPSEKDTRGGGKKKRQTSAAVGEKPAARPPVAVMFVPYTKGGELAKRLTEAEIKLESQTGIRIKIVEKTGTRLEEILHKSNPWQGADCGREGCILCQTKKETGKFENQDCT